MTLIGFRAANHPQQVAARGRNESVDDRRTPPEVFDPLHKVFRFTVDAAASAENALLERYWTEADNGLIRPWAGETVWCNPPYSDIRPWVIKAWEEPAAVVVMIVPANRTEQKWWQEWIEPDRDRGGRLHTEFLAGRIRFIPAGADRAAPNSRPPFGSVLLVWGKG